MNKKKISLYIILFSFLISIFVSQYNIENFDKNIYTDEGIIYHQMIKSGSFSKVTSTRAGIFCELISP